MFQLFDGDKPAQYPEHDVHPSWTNSKFSTFDEAKEYAWKWLGPYGGSYDGTYGVDLQLGVKYDYSGMGTYIEIREVD